MDGSDLLVAMANPGAVAAVDEINKATNWSIRPAFAVRSELQRVINQMYGPEGGAPEIEITQVDGTSVATPRAVEDVETELHVNTLLERVVELGGSDLHLTSGRPPMARVNGDIEVIEGFPVLTGSEIRRMIYAILTQKQREKFESVLELDTSHSVPDVGRFRVNVFLQRDSVGSVMRVIPYDIKPLEELGLPQSVATVADMMRGLVLVTGPTGSGQVDDAGVDRRHHQPHQAGAHHDGRGPDRVPPHHKMAIVNQRELGEDTYSFAAALKHVLRQDPDVILVGEMRDNETIGAALTAAETGHLVFGTLHTQDAPQSIDRIIDVFPPEQQQQIRIQLASSLQAVVTQQLIPRMSGMGRALAAEVLIATPAVRNLIRRGPRPTRSCR